MSRIAVIVSCFNRKATTLSGLASLFAQQKIEDLSLSVYLVDDGSTDGTAEAVAHAFPAVHVLRGDGSLWWVGAMRMGIAAAMKDGYDGYIWWNDDTELLGDAIHRLVECARDTAPTMGPAIIAGSTCVKETGALSFGGWRRYTAGLRLEFSLVEPDPTKPLRVDTMNGNFTLIPDAIARRIGNMEEGFLHRLADWDYGLRATTAGLPVVLAPGFFGYCMPDAKADLWKDRTLPFEVRWKHFRSPRGINLKEWFLYTRRHFGWRFPLYFVSPYVKVMLR